MHKKVFILILLDQVTKLLFSSRDFFLGPLHVHLVKNFGLAFSINFGLVTNLTLVIAALLFFGYYYFIRRHSFGVMYKVLFAMIFAGAISNLADRLYLGYVRDFLDLGLGFTFNLADSFLAIGLVGVLFLYKETKTDLNRDF